MKPTLVLFLLSLLFPGAHLWGQEAVAVLPMHEVRVASPSFEGVAAAARSSDAALTLFVPQQRDPLTVPFASMERLEVRRPVSRARGALKGAKWGALAGAAVGVVTYGLSQSLFRDTDTFRDVNWVATGSFFVLGGGAVGAGVGAYYPGGRWEPVPEPIRLRVIR